MTLDDEPGLGAGFDVLAGLIDAVPVGALLADVRGTIRLVNRELADTLGYDATELVGRPVEDLLPRRCVLRTRAGAPASCSSRSAGRWGRGARCMRG